MRRSTRSFVAMVAAAAAAVMLAPLAPAAAGAGVGGTSRAAAPVEYVALGDSYSAAPLVPGPAGKESMRTDPSGCARSWNNYPAYVADFLDVARYTDVTCSGAQVQDLFTAQGGSTPFVAPQLDALSADTDLVTIGIGGNDYGLFGSLISSCGTLHAAHPEQHAPCQRHFTVDGLDTKLRDATLIRSRIVSAVRAVRAAAPDADVYVVGYPRLLPKRGTCDAIGFAAGDVTWGDAVEKRLNRSLRRGAHSQGATFVGLGAASEGHDACAGDKAWINGKNTVFGGAYGAASFHPYRTGERGMAREVYRVITGRTAPTNGNAHPPADAIVLNAPYPSAG